MGAIIAIGGGRYSDGEIDNILDYIFNLPGKAHPTVTILPTASFDNMDEDTPPFAFFAGKGARMQILRTSDPNLRDEDMHRMILSSDIIYVLGGHLVHLMEEWEAHGICECMRRAFEKNIVLSGYSSGSMCWFRRGYDDCGPEHSFVFRDCIGLLPYCNCVHYESDSWQSFTERVKEQEDSAIALDDGAALIFRDGKYSLLFGRDPETCAYFLDAGDHFRKTVLNPDELK